MKVRNGFVSNSSSSSFLIYGVHGQYPLTDEAKKIIYEKNDEYKSKSYEEFLDSIDDYDFDVDESLYTVSEKLNIDKDLESISMGYGDDDYIGISWSRVKDDETSLQFKNRVKENIRKVYEVEDEEFNTFEEAWFDG